MKQRPWKNAEFQLALHGLFSLLCYSIQTTCLVVTLHIVAWTLSHQSSMEKIPTAQSGWELSQLIFSLPNDSDSSQIDIKLTS